MVTLLNLIINLDFRAGKNYGILQFAEVQFNIKRIYAKTPQDLRKYTICILIDLSKNADFGKAG